MQIYFRQEGGSYVNATGTLSALQLKQMEQRATKDSGKTSIPVVAVMGPSEDPRIAGDIIFAIDVFERFDEVSIRDYMENINTTIN